MTALTFQQRYAPELRRDVLRRSAFPAKRNHPFPTTSTSRNLESDLFRWLRTQAFRTLNAGFSFSPVADVEEFEDAYTVEEIALAFHLFALVQDEVDLPAVIEHRYSVPDPSEWDELLQDGTIVSTVTVEPAVIRSGIRLVNEHTNRRDETFGLLGHDQMVERCLRVARFVIEAHDPTFTARLSEAGRKGGTKSRRGPKYVPAMLDGLTEAQRHNPWRVAAALGCSEQTARCLIKEAK